MLYEKSMEDHALGNPGQGDITVETTLIEDAYSHHGKKEVPYGTSTNPYENETMVPTGFLGRGKLMHSCRTNCTNDSSEDAMTIGSPIPEN